MAVRNIILTGFIIFSAPSSFAQNGNELFNNNCAACHTNRKRKINRSRFNPHMFIAELNLYLNYIQEEITRDKNSGQFAGKQKYYSTFHQNLVAGIAYYRQLSNMISPETNFEKILDDAEQGLTSILASGSPVSPGLSQIQPEYS